MSFDVLVIGQGLAGSILEETLTRRGKKVLVMDPGHTASASHAAVGLYNPVVLKRMKLVWKGKEFLDSAMKFYATYEERYRTNILHRLPVARSVNTADEENEWNTCLGDDRFHELLEGDLLPNTYSGIKGKRWGIVKKSGRIDVRKFLKHRRDALSSEGRLREERLDISRLTRKEDMWSYGDIQAHRIVFCIGIDQISLGADYIQPNKGEVMEIEFNEAPRIDHILKSKVFLCPVSERRAAVGATYSRDIEDPEPTQEGRAELIEELAKFCELPYTITDHWSGMRPTIRDRRPVLGPWGEGEIYMLNGLGSRGVLMAPWLASHLYEHMFENAPILPELDVRRFPA